MQDIKINITYSVTTNTFSTPNSKQSISQQIADTIRKVPEESSNSNKKNDEKLMARIQAKVKHGKKLSSKEETYLKEHNPELYMQYVRIRKMAQCLENQLNHARSKEEVNDIIFHSLNSISDKDPYKEAIINALQKVIKDFQKSDAFQKLPATEEEALNHKKSKKTDNTEEQDNDTEDCSNTTDDDLDPVTWSPLQDVIDAMPTFEMSS